MQIKNREQLIETGILNPSSQDWRVRVDFVDGTEHFVRVAPGKVSEETAIERAKNHLKIVDMTVVKDISAQRVSKSMTVAPFGMVQK